jgi:hypothetical protein
VAPRGSCKARTDRPEDDVGPGFALHAQKFGDPAIGRGFVVVEESDEPSFRGAHAGVTRVGDAGARLVYDGNVSVGAVGEMVKLVERAACGIVVDENDLERRIALLSESRSCGG